MRSKAFWLSNYTLYYRCRGVHLGHRVIFPNEGLPVVDAMPCCRLPGPTMERLKQLYRTSLLMPASAYGLRAEMVEEIEHALSTDRT